MSRIRRSTAMVFLYHASSHQGYTWRAQVLHHSVKEVQQGRIASHRSHYTIPNYHASGEQKFPPNILSQIWHVLIPSAGRISDKQRGTDKIGFPGGNSLKAFEFGHRRSFEVDYEAANVELRGLDRHEVV